MKQRIETFTGIVAENPQIRDFFTDDAFQPFLKELWDHLSIFSDADWAVASKMKPQLRSILRLHLKKAQFPEDQISAVVNACYEAYANSDSEEKPPAEKEPKKMYIPAPDLLPGKKAKEKQKWLLGFVSYAERTAASENYKGKVILPGKNDVDVLEMARFFATRATVPEPAICEKIGVHYDYDVVHTTKWFAGQVSTKVIVYVHTTQNHSSRRTYNCFRNPLSLLWIAVVLGEEDDTLIRAAEEMKANWTNLSSACAAVRRVIPFDRIMTLWRNRPE